MTGSIAGFSVDVHARRTLLIEGVLLLMISEPMTSTWRLWFAVAAGIGSSCQYPRPADVGVESDGGVDAPPAGTALSCLGLAATCGAGGDGDCCASLPVPGGRFFRGYDVSADAIAGDISNPATVSSFRLDKYEVTVGRFRKFLAAGKGTQEDAPLSNEGAHSKIAASGWNSAWSDDLEPNLPTLLVALRCSPDQRTWTDAVGGNETRPINCVTWFEAMAFCIWDGGYLPTEAEWNYAAAGGSEQRAYPWSDPASSTAIDAAHASYYDGANCVGDGQPGCLVTDLVTVGSLSAGEGRWGQADMAGNVFEWTLDRHANPYPDRTSCSDCAQLAGDELRVMRGGGFTNSAQFLRTNYRGNPPGTRIPYMGVRCAREP